MILNQRKQRQAGNDQSDAGRQQVGKQAYISNKETYADHCDIKILHFRIIVFVVYPCAAGKYRNRYKQIENAVPIADKTVKQSCTISQYFKISSENRKHRIFTAGQKDAGEKP